MELEEMNHWWSEKEVNEKFVPKIKRDTFAKIKEDFKRKQIKVLIGLRRTGKTTLMYQIIDDLIKKGIDPLQILFLNFDEPELQQKRVSEILKDYEKLTKTDYKQKQIYLFLDEVQKSKNWVDDVKLIYDNFQNIKIFVSGSASLNLFSEAKKSWAGRAIYYELKPLSFKEFLKFKGVEFEEKRIEIYKEKLKKEFDSFIFRAFPEIIKEEDLSFIKNYIRSVVIEPIILKDIPKQFKQIDILLLEQIVNIFMKQPGEYLRVDNLAKELKRSKLTIYNVVSYLEFSFLIRKVFNYRASIRAASRKLLRIYPYHPLLSLPFGIEEDKFAESLVCFELGSRYYWREKEKEIDFLFDSTPVEVKMKSQIKEEDKRNMKYFLRRYGKTLGCKEGLLITKEIEAKEGNISLIPLWKFCLNF